MLASARAEGVSIRTLATALELLYRGLFVIQAQPEPQSQETPRSVVPDVLVGEWDGGSGPANAPTCSSSTPCRATSFGRPPSIPKLGADLLVQRTAVKRGVMSVRASPGCGGWRNAGHSGGVVRVDQHLVDERLETGRCGVGGATGLVRLYPSLIECSGHLRKELRHVVRDARLDK